MMQLIRSSLRTRTGRQRGASVFAGSGGETRWSKRRKKRDRRDRRNGRDGCCYNGYNGRNGS
jgi:hypothetical protein